MSVRLDGATTIDMTRFVHQGDTVVWGQGPAEPVILTSALLEQRAEIGPFRCFIGTSICNTARPEHADVISFVSYCGTAGNRDLDRVGALDVLPSNYSQLPKLFATRAFPVDVLLLLLPPPDQHGRYSMGIADEYLSAAMDHASVVVAEVNANVPWTFGSRTLAESEIDHIVHSSRPLVDYVTRPPDAVEERIGARVAELIEDGSTLQVGLGTVPRAVLANLRNHRRLGVHSGLICDEVVDLMRARVIDCSAKSIDTGVAVTGVLMGSRKLLTYAHRNDMISVCPTSYTHDPQLLAEQSRLVAINSAMEVDLTGQINAESAYTSYVGAVGGAADFLRGACRSEGGLPIIALPATSSRGRSRIVASLDGPVSTARSDAGIIVTEYGVADLRGRTLGERCELLLRIAHPDHRDALADQMDRRLRGYDETNLEERSLD